MASVESIPPLGTNISKSEELKIPGMESKNSGSVLLGVILQEGLPPTALPNSPDAWIHVFRAWGTRHHMTACGLKHKLHFVRLNSLLARDFLSPNGPCDGVFSKPFHQASCWWVKENVISPVISKGRTPLVYLLSVR